VRVEIFGTNVVCKERSFPMVGKKFWALALFLFCMMSGDVLIAMISPDAVPVEQIGRKDGKKKNKKDKKGKKKKKDKKRKQKRGKRKDKKKKQKGDRKGKKEKRGPKKKRVEPAVPVV
jgi:hypothetical protein